MNISILRTDRYLWPYSRYTYKESIVFQKMLIKGILKQISQIPLVVTFTRKTGPLVKIREKPDPTWNFVKNQTSP